MSARRLAHADRQPEPWKNGGGVTFTVAAHPLDASVADFDWRISIAEIDSAGPFSSFPGIDRVICMLEGARFRLRLDDAVFALNAHSPPLAFPGEALAFGNVPEGAVADLNVMTRRGRACQRLRRLGLGPAKLRGDVLLFVAQQAALLTMAGGESLRLQARDAALFEPAAQSAAFVIEEGVGVGIEIDNLAAL